MGLEGRQRFYLLSRALVPAILLLSFAMVFGLPRFLSDDYFRGHASATQATVLSTERLKSSECAPAGCKDVNLNISWLTKSGETRTATVGSYETELQPVPKDGSTVAIFYDRSSKYGPQLRSPNDSQPDVDRGFIWIVIGSALFTSFGYFLIRSNWDYTVARGRALAQSDSYSRLQALNALGDPVDFPFQQRKRRKEKLERQQLTADEDELNG